MNRIITITLKLKSLVYLLVCLALIGSTVGVCYATPLDEKASYWVWQEWAWLTGDYYGMLRSDRAKTLDGALELAARLHDLAEQVDDKAPPSPHLSYILQMWTVEIAPYFAYEGITDVEMYPTLIDWTNFTGDRNFHVLGSARCPGGAVGINIRYVNPMSPWYDNNPLATLVHELGHTAGICSPLDPSGEPATQMATLEVLAAMASQDNAYALPAFLDELTSFVMDYAMYLAMAEGRMGDYLAAYERMVAGDPIRMAGLDKSLRHWQGHEKELLDILERYGAVPYQLLRSAMLSPVNLSPELRPVPNGMHRIAMDDTQYLLMHLRGMAEAYAPEVPDVD